MDYQDAVTEGKVSVVSEVLLLGSERSCGKQSGASVVYCTLSWVTLLEETETGKGKLTGLVQLCTSHK